MASPPEYVFTRDVWDDNRINLQHYMWVQLFGYHLHPSIPIDASSPVRIADVGTGTGIWLMDLAQKLPDTVRLDGLDVSFDATPPAASLPPNVTLQQWDITAPPPATLFGQYDIVHVRNFAFVLKDQDIPRILRNVVDLLKPGGYLQWGEADVSSFRIETVDSASKTNSLRRLLEVSQGQDSRLAPTWVPNMPKLFAEAGLTNPICDVRDAPPYMAFVMHECGLMIHELVARQTGNQEVAKAIQSLMAEVVKETKRGAWWAFTRWTVLATKP